MLPLSPPSRGRGRPDRDGGFEALYPKPRTDRGKPRRLPPAVAERLVALKADNPSWSVRAIIRAAVDEGIDHPLAPSTVHRLLSREGLFDGKPPDGAGQRERDGLELDVPFARQPRVHRKQEVAPVHRYAVTRVEHYRRFRGLRRRRERAEVA